MTNPIVIHSATAFVRLYWFQKRFAHIVKETNSRLNIRKTKSRAQSMEQEERGVAGREIRVLFDSGRNQQVGGTPRRSLSHDGVEDLIERRKSSTHAPADRISFASMLPRRTSTVPDEAQDSLMSAEESDPVALSANTSESAGSMVKREVEERRDSDDGRPMSIASQAIADDEDEKDQLGLVKTSDNRNTADIRFAELPVARKPQAENSGHLRSGSIGGPLRAHVTDNPLHRSRTAETNGRSLGSTLIEFGQRTMTMDGVNRTNRIHRRRASSVSRFPMRTNTIERTITTAFRRRRDSSPGGRSANVREMTLPYISFQPTIGRNSAFVSLNKEQREELGGIEYRATRTLCWVLVSYFFGIHVLGFVCYMAFIYSAQQYIPVVASTGTSRGWWSVFTSASAFNDLGLTLTPDSFISFQNAAFLLLVSSFLIVAGNTGFPCVLRFVIWLAYKIWPGGPATKEEFAFLLDHPRRCFTLLFPGPATWWLLAILIGLNGLDLVLFIILDLGNAEITEIPVGYRILDGLFQAFCTRTAGFTAVNLAGLHSAILVSYMIMMWVEHHAERISC